MAGATTHHGDPLVTIPRVGRGHRHHGLYHLVGDRLTRGTRTLPLRFIPRQAIPTAGCHADQPQDRRLPGRWRLLVFQRVANHATVLRAQGDWPESFFKMRLAIVSSPIT